MRVADGAVAHKDLGHGIGHIHVLNGNGHQSYPPLYISPTPARSRRTVELDYEAILRRWHAHAPADALSELARRLGVSYESLERLNVAYCPERRAWAFPMHDDRRCVIGIRLRTDDGRKFALDGSHNGLFVPSGLDSRSTLLICEGPTDTAAALTLDFSAIGRPSCSGGTSFLCDLLWASRRRDVVIVADVDGPGRYGAHQLADRVIGLCRSVKVITTRPHKDLRAWLFAGAPRQALQMRIDTANYHRNNGDGH